METIKKYIEFGIDNGYKEYDIEWYEMTEILKWPEYYKIIITSKEFIESIARWIYKNKELFVNYWRDEPFIKDPKDYEELLKEEDFENIYKHSLMTNITINQAIAIRDNQLEQYITNLWI